MNWQDERWVKLYTRDSITWKLWGWQARFVMMSLMRKVDRAGVVDVDGRGVVGLAALLEIPADIVRDGIEQLVVPDDNGDATVVWNGPQLVVLRFIEAQEAHTSTTQRQRDSRERRRDFAKRGCTAPVTPRDDVSRYVTGADPLLLGFGDVQPGSGPTAPVTPCDQHPPKTNKRSRGVTGRSRGVTKSAESVTPRVEERGALRAVSAFSPDPLLEHFAERVKVISSGRRALSVKSMSKRLRAAFVAKLEEHGEAAVRRRIDIAIDHPPDWPAGPWTIATFVQHFDLLTEPDTRRTNGARGKHPAVGRVEPSQPHEYNDNPFGDRMPWEDDDAR